MGSGLTTNQVLFDCEVDLLNGKPLESTHMKVVDFINDYYFNKGKEINNNFSHDNWKGVACWANRFDKCLLKLVPVFGRHSLRPDNFAFFLYVKNKYVGIFFIWIYLLFQIIDAITMKRDDQGIPHTSGLLLNYFVLQAFEFNLTFRFVSWRVGQSFIRGWLGVFTKYYNQEDNVRVLDTYKEVNL